MDQNLFKDSGQGEHSESKIPNDPKPEIIFVLRT
jgi:hypothetical protein